MDIKSLKVAATGTIHVKDAAGEPLYDGDKPVRIIVHGPGSRAFATVRSRQTARIVARMNENDGKVTSATAEEELAERVEDLSALTISFDGLTDDDKSGAELFASVYGDPELGFIANQVEKHLRDWGKFKVGSAAA